MEKFYHHFPKKIASKPELTAAINAGKCPTPEIFLDEIKER